MLQLYVTGASFLSFR